MNEDDFDRFNRKLVLEMVDAIHDLNLVYDDISPDEKKMYGKDYIHCYKEMVRLYHIGCRKSIHPQDSEINSPEENFDGKLKEIREILRGFS